MNAIGGSPARLSLPLLILFALPTLPMYLLRGPAFSILPALYAERYAIALTTISGLLLLVRLADGFLDVAVGWGTDVTQHRWGGRKPWFLAGSLLTVACIFQLYVPPTTATALYFGTWFFIAYAAWTVNEIPYGAWAAELSDDYRERSRIAVARQYFNVGSVVLLGLIPFLPMLPSRDMNFQALEVVAWIVALTLPAISLLCVWLVPQGAVALRSTGHGLRDSWQAVKGNLPFLRFAGAAGLAGLADACSAGVGFMIIDSYFGLGQAMAYALLQWAGASLLGVWIGQRLLRRLEKHQVFALGAGLASAMMAANSVLGPGVPHLLWAYLILSFVLFVGAVVADMTPQAMIGDLVDYDLMRTGVNRSGQYVAVLTFVRKATFGLGASMSIFIAGSFGFEPGNAPYAAEAAFGLKLAGFWLPAVLFATATLLMWRYPLTAARHGVVQRRNARRAKHDVRVHRPAQPADDPTPQRG
jgi:glycoside/pentoside/hexuronide:cation symporter, GPH family